MHAAGSSCLQPPKAGRNARFAARSAPVQLGRARARGQVQAGSAVERTPGLHRLRAPCLAALAALLSQCLVAAEAQPAEPSATDADSHRLKWHPSWRRVGVPEYVSTALLGTGILALHWVGPADRHWWDGPILHDDWMRDRFRLGSRQGRSRASTWSDALDLAAMGHLLIVDNLLVTAVADANTDVAFQIAVINLQSYALSMFVNRLTKRLTQRARPYVGPCREDPETDDRCGSRSSYSSFYSGHAASTATSAGLICAHHTHLALYGGGLPDVGTCALAVTATTTTGALRIASDNHWATDVLVGHVTGYLAGYLLPTLIYYREPRTKPLDDTGSRVQTTGFILPRPGGVEIGLGGIF
jgi:membrane-associated phospholipid phosphatase